MIDFIGDDIQLGSNPDPDAWLIELQQSTMKLHVQTRTSHTKMNLEKFLDSKLLSMNSSQIGSRNTNTLDRHFSSYNLSSRRNYWSNLMKDNSRASSCDSSSAQLLTSSSSRSNNLAGSSRSSSIESVYHDASSVLLTDQRNDCTSIQVCEGNPIASKLIDIIHYSITKDSSCSNSSINFMLRLLLGKFIER